MKKLVGLCFAGSFVFLACGKSSDSAPVGASSAAPAALPASAAAAAPAAAPAAPVDASLFSVVAEAPERIALTAMKGGAIAQIAHVPFSLVEGPLSQEPNFTRGIKKGEWGNVAGGEWPKSAWIEATDAEGTTKLYKWFDALGGRWEPQQILRENEKLLDLGVVGDNVIAAIAMPTNDIRMQVVGGKGGVIPAPASVPKKEAAADDGAEAPAEDDGSCKVKMSPRSTYLLTGTAAGDAFAAGSMCSDGGAAGALVAERWEPKKQRGTLEPLPAATGGAALLSGILAVSATEAYVYGDAGGKAYLAVWDGKAWALDANAFPKGITKMAAADDGTIYAAAGDVFKKKAGGAWESVVLPTKLVGFVADSLYARNATDVWISGKAEGRYFLLRSAKIEKSAAMPKASEVEDTMRSNLRWLATPLCAKPYAHLFSVGPSASPVPKEFPMVKSAFEGKKPEGATLVLEDDGRNLYVGAKAKNIEQADEIIKKFGEANPKVKARVFCHDPQVKKELEWP